MRYPRKAGRVPRTGAATAQYIAASTLRSSLSARLSPIGALLVGLPGAEVGADSVHAGEILREQVRVANRDPEMPFQEDHDLQEAQGIEDAALQQRGVTR